MNTERVGRARFAAEVHRKGTLLSDEAIADVCEALLEVIEGGVITLELHEEITAKLREQLKAADVRGSNGDLEMYAKAWERELGPPFVAKMHRIDSLVLTTRKRMEELRSLRVRSAELDAALAASRADLRELMAYVDQAKMEAQKLGRMQGEPLPEFLERMSDVIRNGGRD